jgi:hypothetical protein
MAKFLLLYSGGSMPETEVEVAAVTQAWIAWYTGLGSAVVDPGNPFGPSAMTVASDGAVRNGPMGTMATGYTVLGADSMSAAVNMAQSCPVLQGGAANTVYEVLDMM